MKTQRIQVIGLVQGVFFRANTKKEADELGIVGWVRNNKERTDVVEILAQGNEESLNTFTQWCYKGPEKAEVHSVVITDAEPTTAKTFEIQR